MNWRLVADVGGTNVRFARAASPQSIGERRAYRGADFATFEDALALYLRETGGSDACCGFAIGAAGPVSNNAVKLTNSPWRIEGARVSALLSGAPGRIVNDLQAVAFSLPILTGEDIAPLGPVLTPDRTLPMLAVNIGTGFGAASVFEENGRWISRGAEPGHMALGCITDEERRFFDGFETVEDVLSGRGVVALHRRVALHHGVEPVSDVAAIFHPHDAQPGIARSDTLRLLTALIGRVAGDLALATGAWGGVFFCGSVARAWARIADSAAMRASFERKGLMTARMAGVYTGVIRNESADLLGLATLPLD